MSTILDKIIQKKWDSEGHLFENFSASAFLNIKRQTLVDVLPIIRRDFFVIAEVKKGSPSKGIIRENFQPVEIAADYQRAGASAISVITEEHFFYGNKQYLSSVKNHVHLPVLRKDFLIHPYQIYESYQMGADFLLLIAACLSDDLLEKLYRLTLSLGMHALIEIHTKEELDRVFKLQPYIIGINNRDLKTFNVDLKTSFDLKRLIPEDIFVISESGIRSPDDIAALKDAGFSGALIGESLLKQHDTGAALSQLLHKQKN